MCLVLGYVLYILLSRTIETIATTDGVQQSFKVAHGDRPWFDDAFDAFVKATLQEQHVPGLSVAVVDDGEIFSKGHGVAEFPDHIATPNTQYMTGSTTKAFTAAAAASLVHNESYTRFEWTSPIQDFIREDFALDSEYATAHITIEDALSHRTGLPRHDYVEGQLGDTPSALVRRLRYLPMTVEPRTLWQYCNLMYAVMTDVLETIEGVTLEAILASYFWKPLGMLSTTFDPHSTGSDSSSRLARGYYWDPATTEYVPEPYDDNSANPGAGAIYSTVNDYALWTKAFLDAADADAPANKSSPISPSIFHDLVTARAILPDFAGGQDPTYGFITPPLYALGWMTVQILGETIVTHSGSQTGFGANVYMLPARGFSIVTMGNTETTSNLAGSAIASRLMLRKLNLTSVYGHNAMSSLQETLLDLSSVTWPLPKTTQQSRRRKASKFLSPFSQHIQLPLPGTIMDYAGLYSHPAYGSINFTLVHCPSAASPAAAYLEGLIYPRIWPLKVQLFHHIGTVFDVKYFSPHGLGDIRSGEGIVWEDEGGDAKAVFALELDGGVEMLGLEIDEGMVEAARRKGEECWREGMIWFQRV